MPVDHVRMTHASHSVEHANASKAWCVLWALALTPAMLGCRFTSNEQWRFPTLESGIADIYC